MTEENPFTFKDQMQAHLQRNALDLLALAISPWRFSARDRYNWEQGVLRVRHGECLMKREAAKNGGQ